MEEKINYWIPLSEYEGLYEINIHGQIKRLSKISTYYQQNILKHRTLKTIILKPIIQKRTGYYTVNLTKDKKLKTVSVHRLIAKNFIENPLNKPDVNHKNGIKTDNFIENLEWCTKRENLIHALKNGLINHDFRKRPQSKLSDSQVKEIKYLLKDKITIKQIALQFKVSMCLIQTIKSEKRFKWIKI